MIKRLKITCPHCETKVGLMQNSNLDRVDITYDETFAPPEWADIFTGEKQCYHCGGRFTIKTGYSKIKALSFRGVPVEKEGTENGTKISKESAASVNLVSGL